MATVELNDIDTTDICVDGSAIYGYMVFTEGSSTLKITGVTFDPNSIGTVDVLLDDDLQQITFVGLTPGVVVITGFTLSDTSSVPFDLILNVVAPPTVTVPDIPDVCACNTVNVTVGADEGVEISATASGPIIIETQVGNTFVLRGLQPGGIGVLTVTAKLNGCVHTFSKKVKVIGAIRKPVIHGPCKVRCGDTVQFSFDPQDGVKYTWEINGRCIPADCKNPLCLTVTKPLSCVVLKAETDCECVTVERKICFEAECAPVAPAFSFWPWGAAGSAAVVGGFFWWFGNPCAGGAVSVSVEEQSCSPPKHRRKSCDSQDDSHGARKAGAGAGARKGRSVRKGRGRK